MLPDDVSPKDLLPSARNELKTLSAENAERVARHMAMAARAIDDDPALAHEHASAAMRHAGRVAVVRETLAITAYATGDFALALRELRTVRRISGRNDHIAMIVDSERGVGRPEKALEEGRSADRAALPVAQRAELAIAMSGARLDLGQVELALHELDIPEADPDRAFEWSPGLFAARAAVLEELGRADESAEWSRRAEIAGEAIAARLAEDDTVEIHEVDIPRADVDRDAWADPSVSEGAEADESIPQAAATPHVPAATPHVDVESAEERSAAAPRVDEGRADDMSADEEPAVEKAANVDEPVVEVSADVEPAFEETAVEKSPDEGAADTVSDGPAAADAQTPAVPEADGNALASEKGSTDGGPAAEATAPAPAGIADDAAYDPGEGEQSIEDEVSEILAAAGIVDDADSLHADDTDASDAAASELDADAKAADEVTDATNEKRGSSDEEDDRPDGALF